MPALTTILLVVAALLLLSVVASKAATRFGVPALLLFLVVGMLAGSDGPGGIWFSDAEVAQTIGIIALAFILFASGLDTDWRDVRPVVRSAASLATIGIALSAAIIGIAAYLLLGVPLLRGLLVGAIVSSTDAAAVFSVLRSRGVNLRGDVRPLIELESGSNDPMAVFLTIAIIERIVNPQAALLVFIGELVLEMTVGAIAGLVLGRAAAWLLNRIRLEYDGLYPVLTLALVLVTYSLTDLLRGNGFLAVYIAGIVLGNRRFIHRRSILRFHDGIAWLMQITMFLALGLLAFPSRLPAVAGMGMTIAVIGTFVARPVAVFISLAFSRYDWREKLFISWAGLRGAVPIILATFALTAGLTASDTIFHVVFFSVLVSVLVQGSSIPLAARILGVSSPAPAVRQETSVPIRRDSDLMTIDLEEGSPAIGRQLVDLPLPADTHVVLVYRGDAFFPANGATTFVRGDRLMVFTSKASVDRARRILQGTVA